jgi:hypothetical protein
MKAVIFLSGLAGLVIFGPPVLRSRIHHPEISVIVHDHVRTPDRHGGQSDCRFEAERSLRVPAGSVRELRLQAGSGSLEVVGVDGLGEVRAVARACASHEEFLDDLQVTSETEGSTLVMETHYPDQRDWRGGNRYARLDLRVEVPGGLAADIQDGSGEMGVANLGSTFIQDGSGEVVIDGIDGDLTVQDGSGQLEKVVLKGVGADVEIHDSSGELEITGIGGSLTLHDSSGEIGVQDVVGSVTVVQDGSGGIDVRGVGGDFIVERDGSGDIEYAEVQGAVKIPKKKGH